MSVLAERTAVHGAVTRSGPRRLTPGVAGRRGAVVLLALVWLVIVAAPVYYMFVVSLQPAADFLSGGNPWVPAGGITADNYAAAKNSPHLEIFRKKGVEVLLMTDRVDEWMLSFLHEVEGKELVSVAKGGLDLGKLEDEAEKKQHEETESQYKDLVEKMKASLADKAKDVRITFRLTDSPACLVADEHELSANLVRMLKAAGQNAPETKPILEINPDHPLVQRLKYEEAKFDDWSNILFDQAALAEGGSLADPAAFVKRLNQMLLDMASK